MKKTKRTELACERSTAEGADYIVKIRQLNDIDCIYSYSKSDKKIESITLCTGRIWKYDSDFLQGLLSALTKCLKELIYENSGCAEKILIVCLGNSKILHDSLGPKAADMLTPTRHIKAKGSKTAILVTGVEGQSGFSSLDLINSVTNMWRPDLVLAIDSLSARGVERILSTIQLSSHGISPGSGIGNAKSEISHKTLNIPVIAIGVPTVACLPVESSKKPDNVDDFYITLLESEIGINAYAKLISNALESIYFHNKIIK